MLVLFAHLNNKGYEEYTLWLKIDKAAIFSLFLVRVICVLEEGRYPLLLQNTADVQQTVKDKIFGLKLGAQEFTGNFNFHYDRNSSL